MRLVLALLTLTACASREPDAAPTPAAPIDGGLVINELAAAGAPTDWFEVVNTSDAPIELRGFVFVDHEGDFTRARPFPEKTLAPHERHVQEITKASLGFALGKSDALWIYRAEDRALIDGVSWSAGASPEGKAYARVPDERGAFESRAPTPGEANVVTATAER